ncbi:unnamed protein product [Cuscuta campestris]|uniref:Retrovirus-related Pol polyprotein from transposon TNT 1-94-like beta-barrel domain-containing protein n=1 Tax=Cuscuta campestris TaxID=132261 RepID=A0A484MCS9_9ASTE|nr:unnamed protein product [Cuscuta campestris]
MKEEEQVPIIKKTMALKIDDHPESEGESDEELAMFKRYKKFMKWNKGESSKRFPSKKGKPNQITCYESGNVGHIKLECPKLKKKEELKKGKKKALKVTWDDLNSDESDSDQSQEENANACFTASNDEEEVKNTTWVVDSGCSRHMTGTRGWFTNLKERSHGHVTLRDKSRKKVIGKDPSITAVVASKTFGFNTQNLSEWFHLERQGVSSYCKKGWISDSQDFNADFFLRVLNNIALDHVFEDQDYFLRRPNVQDLTANRFILLKILKENVIPVLNKNKQVGIYECTLLYLLLTHKKNNPQIGVSCFLGLSLASSLPNGLHFQKSFQVVQEIHPQDRGGSDEETSGKPR